MNVTELQFQLKALGIELVADGDRLRVSTGTGALSPDLQTAIREHRAELLRIFERREQKQLLPGQFKNGEPPLWVLYRFGPDNTSYDMAWFWPGNGHHHAARVATASQG